jgi:hypothetical protein
MRVLPPAIEQRDLVTPRERRLDDVPPDEHRPAEDQQLHA